MKHTVFSKTGFDSIKQINPYGEEYWSARGLAPLLGYVQWRNFEQAIKKAMIACKETGNIVEYHFADASKPITGGKGAVQNKSIATHLYVGSEVRKAIEAINAPMPEDLPPAPSIRKMVEERRRAARKRRVKIKQQHDQPSLLDSGDGLLP